MKRVGWQAWAALLAGLVLGLIYAWMISPLRYVDTTPDTLRQDFRERYRVAIAAAYASTGNLERARARLSLLGDPDPIQALSSQAQQMLAAGEDFETVRQVAQLASDLQSQGPVAGISSPTLEFSSLPSHTPGSGIGTMAPAASGPPGAESSSPVPESTAPAGTPTPRPTRTPIPAPGAPFELAAQDTVCEPALAEGLLQIIVMDTRRRQIPGAEIVVLWAGGEDHFFTGFKPELGDGYADYLMQAGVIYSVRIAQGGAPVADVTTPSCAAADGRTYNGGIRLTFHQQ